MKQSIRQCSILGTFILFYIIHPMIRDYDKIGEMLNISSLMLLRLKKCFMS